MCQPGTAICSDFGAFYVVHERSFDVTDAPCDLAMAPESIYLLQNGQRKDWTPGLWGFARDSDRGIFVTYGYRLTHSTNGHPQMLAVH